MATTKTYRDIIDVVDWRQISPPVHAGVNSINVAGTYIAEDLRNNDYAHPLFYFLAGLNDLRYYNIKADAWGQSTSSAFGSGGTFNGGCTAVFVPSISPKGTLSGSNSTTKINISTALPASVAVNQLSNRGDGKGFIIRIIDNGAGGSGKTEEKRVVANTSGTTPTCILESPLSFTPVIGSTYEFLSGSFLALNTGALTANQFRRYDVLTNSFSSLSTTNLIATVPTTSNCLVALDESYVPYNRKCGEGFLVGAGTYNNGLFNCLTATATAAGTITGQASSGDASVVANQYRNFQIRIVEDTTTPTSVGQRRRITSHTAGASAVYTLASNWTVTPSATCKFVIENDTDKIIGFMGGTTTIYNYNITANTWDTTTWAARGGAISTGGWGFQAFGLLPDELGLKKPSNIYSFRGGTAAIDILDIAGAATGSWTNAATIIDASNITYEAFVSTDLVHSAYNPHTEEGKYLYLALGTSSAATNARGLHRLDLISLKLEKIRGITLGSTSSTVTYTTTGKASWVSVFQDGTTKIATFNTSRPNGGLTDFWQYIILR